MKRFWDKVDKTKDCWNWTGCLRGYTGYGCIKIDKKVYDCHRVSYALTYGKIPEGKLVLHKCDNRRCVNPKHLYIGTHKDNVRDSIERGHHHFPDWRASNMSPNKPRGEKVGSSKLKECDVKQIRKIWEKDLDTTQSELAEKFKVSRHAIADVINNETWRHVKTGP